MGVPGGRGGRAGSKGAVRPAKASAVKTWTSKEIQELVKKHDSEAAKATKPSKFPRLLLNFTEETLAVLAMVDSLEYVTDPELIEMYEKAEERRKEYVEAQGGTFEPDYPPDEIPVLSYHACAAVNGWTDYIDSVHKDTAVTEMFASDKGANAALLWDKMVKELLKGAFSVQDELDLITELAKVKMQVGNESTIRDDVTAFCTEVMAIAQRLDQSPTAENQENWISVLNESLQKQVPSTALFMKTGTDGKGFTLAQWCKLLVKRATQVMTTENAFREWQKGHMSAADKEELEMLRRWRNGLEVPPAAKTYVAAVKDPKHEPTTSDNFNGICRKCNKKGHRAKDCPMSQPAPAKPAPAKAKTRQVANVVAAETVAEPPPATVTLTNKQFKELMDRATKQGDSGK